MARIEIAYVSSLVLDDAEVLATFVVERVGATSVTLAETLSAPNGRAAARVSSVTLRHDLPCGHPTPADGRGEGPAGPGLSEVPVAPGPGLLYRR